MLCPKCSEAGLSSSMSENGCPLCKELLVVPEVDHEDFSDDFERWLRECGVVRADGSFNVEQAKLELADYHMLLGQVPKVYSAVTDGMISKPNMLAEVVVSVYEDKTSEWLDRETKELRERIAELSEERSPVSERLINKKHSSMCKATFENSGYFLCQDGADASSLCASLAEFESR